MMPSQFEELFWQEKKFGVNKVVSSDANPRSRSRQSESRRCFCAWTKTELNLSRFNELRLYLAAVSLSVCLPWKRPLAFTIWVVHMFEIIVLILSTFVSSGNGNNVILENEKQLFFLKWHIGACERPRSKVSLARLYYEQNSSAGFWQTGSQ